MNQQVAAPEQTSLALLPPAQRAAIALNVDAYKEQIATKVKESADITAVLDPAGREQAHRIGMVLLKLRTGIKARGEEVRKDATAFGKAVIAAEKELVDLVTPEENRVMALRDAYDAKVRAEKEEAERVEAARVENLKVMLGALRGEVLACYNKTAAVIAERMTALRDDAAGDTDERWAEYLPRAKEVRAEVLTQMQAQYDTQLAVEVEAELARQAAEAEAKRVAAQAEENRLAALAIERQRQELARAQAEIDAENARRAAAEAAERTRVEAEAQAERERVAAETKRQLEAQQAELATQRAAQAAAEAELARKQKEFQDKVDEQAHEDARRKLAADEADRVASLPVERVAAILDGEAPPQNVGIDLANGPDQTVISGAEIASDGSIEVISPADVAAVVNSITLPTMQAQSAAVVTTGDADAISVLREVVRELMGTRTPKFIMDLVAEEIVEFTHLLAAGEE